jgi:membrane-bound lytic murein transglycosylase B
MRKVMLVGTVACAAVAMWAGSAEAAAPPATASCEGALASLAARYAPGTVAYLTHLLQLEAANAGVPMGTLNRAFAQTKGGCGF